MLHMLHIKAHTAQIVLAIPSVNKLISINTLVDNEIPLAFFIIYAYTKDRYLGRFLSLYPLDYRLRLSFRGLTRLAVFLFLSVAILCIAVIKLAIAVKIALILIIQSLVFMLFISFPYLYYSTL